MYTVERQPIFGKHLLFIIYMQTEYKSTRDHVTLLFIPTAEAMPTLFCPISNTK
jgi:hypothetical protein